MTTDGYRALRSGAAAVDIGRGLIAVRGRDRVRLLHSIASNDVKKLAPGSGCYAFLLNPQGRIQADFNLFCFADRFLIDTEAELREKLPALVRKYIIADQVELEDLSASMTAIGVEGPAAAALLAAAGAPVPDADYSHVDWNGAAIAAATATGQPGFRIFLPPGRKEETLRQLGAPLATAEDVRVVRIENGRPRYGEDIFDTSLPQEAQQLHGVSFNKGCYLGQEIVERIRARGHVNRLLVRVEIDTAEAPAPGTKLQAGAGADQAEVGEITSAAYSPQAGKVAALAYVRTPHHASGM